MPGKTLGFRPPPRGIGMMHSVSADQVDPHALLSYAQAIAAQGRHGDTMLAHINPREAMMLKMMGGSGTTNPKTGLKEFFQPYGGLFDLGGMASGQPSVLDAALARAFGHILDRDVGGHGFGADPGTVARNQAEAMRTRGYAPFTAEGLMTAFSNAAGLVKNAPKMGLASMMNQTGIMPEGIPGKIIGALLGSGVQNIPGFSKFDQDLIDAVKSRRMSYGQAIAAQGRRTGRVDPRSGRNMGGGTGNRSVAGGRSVGGLAVGSDGRIAGGI